MQDIVTREIKIIGSYLYTIKDFYESLRLISQKLIDSRALVSRIIILEEGPKYFKKLSNNTEGKLLKIVIDPRKKIKRFLYAKPYKKLSNKIKQMSQQGIK